MYKSGWHGGYLVDSDFFAQCPYSGTHSVQSLESSEPYCSNVGLRDINPVLFSAHSGGGGGAPAAPASRPAPAAAPAAPRPGAGGASTWAPQIPTGPRKMKLGRVGDAKSMPAVGGAGRVPMCNSCGVAIR